MIEDLTVEKLNQYKFTESQIDRLLNGDEYECFYIGNTGYCFASNIEKKIYTGEDGKEKYFFRPLTKFETFDSFFNQLILMEAIENPKTASDKAILQAKYNLTFNTWLLEYKSWEYGNSEQYAELLTKENWKEFTQYENESTLKLKAKLEHEKQSWKVVSNETENETDESNLIYHIKDGKQVLSTWDFINRIGLVKSMKEKGATMNPTHDFKLLKETRLLQLQEQRTAFIKERELNHLETNDFEMNCHYIAWLNHELKVIEQWLSDKYPNGEKKKIKASTSTQIEILKYQNFIKSEIEITTPKITIVPFSQETDVEQNRTKNLIEQHLKETKDYAFNSESDYNIFLELLTNFFEYKPFTLPTELIKLKRGCKTRIAPLFNSIHKALSENKLKNDTDYFKIIKVLNHFSDVTEADIYRVITR